MYAAQLTLPEIEPSDEPQWDYIYNPRLRRTLRVHRTACPRPCGAHCRMATGDDCSCSCGGKNHGCMS